MARSGSPILRALGHFRSYRRRLALLSGISVAGATLEAAGYALIVPLAAAAVSGDGSFALSLLGATWDAPVGVLFAIVVAAVVLRAGVSMFEEYLGATMQARYAADQQARAIAAVLRARWSVQSAEVEGDLQDALTNYLNRAQLGLRNLIAGMRALAGFTIFLCGALVVGGVIALAVLAVLAVLFTLLRPLARAARSNSAEITAETPRFARNLSQSVRMSREIRLFGATDAILEQARGPIERLRHLLVRQRLLGVATPAVYQAAGLLLVVGGIWVASLADVGRVESLAATALLMLKAIQYGRSLQREYHVCNDLLPFVETLEDRLSALEAARDIHHGDVVERLEPLTLDGVSFRYDDEGHVLRDIRFTLAEGDSLGIVGPSGSGKSTLLQLLLRLREPEAGVLLAGGRPASEIAKSCWYERMAFVPQEAQLFTDTIYENIRSYRPSVSRNAVIRAARRAGIADEIEALPDGFATHAGERGTRLSGGQRQRICIARALASEPDVLVFDEPTSALDMHSESAVQRTLRDLRGRTTLIVVAHRLSTLAVCDRILVLREGRVDAYGEREDMERREGYLNEVRQLAGLR